eukprot:1154148-Pelagomonas_calceolata.AAC.1
MPAPMSCLPFWQLPSENAQILHWQSGTSSVRFRLNWLDTKTPSWLFMCGLVGFPKFGCSSLGRRLHFMNSEWLLTLRSFQLGSGTTVARPYSQAGTEGRCSNGGYEQWFQVHNRDMDRQ